MNERIKELIEQAGTVEVPSPTGFDEVVRVFNKERFAELIIAECVKVAMRSVGDDEPKEAWYLIEEHFGVEND